ncbi:MAG: amidohydrolase, partial [Bradyrhizobium sp.]|nr:amidohydrolase [Bradyrhizobium sp.]
MALNRRIGGSDASPRFAGAVDCDLHPAVPAMSVLLPYLDDYWREMVRVRGLDRLNLSLTSYPEHAPISCRPDWKPDSGRKAGSSLAAMQEHVLDRYRPRF